MTLDELDRLAAEKVMGWRKTNIRIAINKGEDKYGLMIVNSWTQRGFTDGKRAIFEDASTSFPYNLEKWQPTRNIAQAWECLEELIQAEIYPDINYNPAGWWHVKLDLVDPFAPSVAIQNSDTAPEAIVRACLKVKGIGL